MQSPIEQYAHDLKRNISAVLAGTTILQRKTTSGESDKKNILSEMSHQCEETLNLLEKLFKDLENVKKGDK